MIPKKVTTVAIRARKQAGPKLSVVTAYDATMARLLDEGGVDVLMVGDSLGMVVQGHDNTLSVTLDEMIYHCGMVARAKPRAHIVCDLPFMSYQVSATEALRSAGRLVQEGGAESVKLEGGRSRAASVMKIVSAGIPVMGHIGLTPQAVHALGGFKVQGKTQQAAQELIKDAKTLRDAGAYAIVVEGVPSDVGQAITEAVDVPTIGIGAGPRMDGQVLVCYDLLGMYGALAPKFVRHFAELGAAVTSAAVSYVHAVQAGAFPEVRHSFAMGEGQSLDATRANPYGPADEEPLS